MTVEVLAAYNAALYDIGLGSGSAVAGVFAPNALIRLGYPLGVMGNSICPADKGDARS
jgi:hypothetical protein